MSLTVFSDMTCTTRMMPSLGMVRSSRFCDCRWVKKKNGEDFLSSLSKSRSLLSLQMSHTLQPCRPRYFHHDQVASHRLEPLYTRGKCRRYKIESWYWFIVLADSIFSWMATFPRFYAFPVSLISIDTDGPVYRERYVFHSYLSRPNIHVAIDWARSNEMMLL